jgi:hypothetical protein
MNDKPKSYSGLKLSKVDLFVIGLTIASLVGVFYALFAISDFALALLFITFANVCITTMRINEVRGASRGVLLFLLGCLAALLGTLTFLIIQYLTAHGTTSSEFFIWLIFNSLLSGLSTSAYTRANKQNAARREQQLLDTTKADPFYTDRLKRGKVKDWR